MADIEDRLHADGEHWRAAQPPPLDVTTALAGRATIRPLGSGWAVAATAAAVFAVVASVAVTRTVSSPPAASPSPTVQRDERGSPSPEPEPTSPPCRAEDLVVDHGTLQDAGDGLAMRTVYFLNTGREACSLTGRPTVTGYTSDGTPALTARGSEDRMGLDPPRDIAPGRQAALAYGTRHGSTCDDPPMITRVALTLPHGGRGLIIDGPGRVCELVVASFGTNWVRMYDPSPDPPELTARIVVAESVRAGTTVPYEVVITNSGGLGVDYECEQIEYLTRLPGTGDPPAEQRRSLGCRGILHVPARGSATVEGKIFVPYRVDGTVTLVWELYGGVVASTPLEVSGAG